MTEYLCNNPSCGAHIYFGKAASSSTVTCKCLQAIYCCVECQRIHWEHHSKICLRLREKWAPEATTRKASIFEFTDKKSIILAICRNATMNVFLDAVTFAPGVKVKCEDNELLCYTIQSQYSGVINRHEGSITMIGLSARQFLSEYVDTCQTSGLCTAYVQACIAAIEIFSLLLKHRTVQIQSKLDQLKQVITKTHHVMMA